MPSIRPGAMHHHIDHIALRMRAADRMEILASHGHDPLRGLNASVWGSDVVWTMFDGEEPVAMFGVGEYLPDVGSPWFLSTCALYRPAVRSFFLRKTNHVLETMHSVGYPLLMQWVSAEHRESLRWMQWAGFSIDEFNPEYGTGRAPFFRLSRIYHV